MESNRVEGSRSKIPTWIALWIGVQALVCAIVFGRFVATKGLPYTLDSWSLYELSQSIDHHFYEVSSFRDLSSRTAETPPVSRSFPPVIPVLTAGIDRVTHSPVSLVLQALLGTVVLIGGVGKLLRISAIPQGGTSWGLATIIVLSNPWYVKEMLSGASVAWAGAAFVWALIAASRDTLPGRWLIAGALLGLTYLSRSDSLLPCLLTVALLAAYLPGFNSSSEGDESATKPPSKLLPFVQMSVALALVVLPYALFQFKNFGSPVSNENVVVMKAASNLYITEYHPNGVPTMSTDKGHFLGKVVKNSAHLVESAINVVLTSAFVLIPLIALRKVEDRKAMTPLSSGEAKMVRALNLGLIAQLGLILGIVLTGYNRERYLIMPQMLAAILTVIHLSRFRIKLSPPTIAALLAAGLVSTGLVASYAVKVVTNNSVYIPGGKVDHASDELAAYLQKNYTGTPVLLEWKPVKPGAKDLSDNDFADREFVYFQAIVAALKGVKTVIMPMNGSLLPPSEVRELAQQYGVTHVLYAGTDRPQVPGLEIGPVEYRVGPYELAKVESPK